MINIERKRYVIIRKDEIFCVAGRNHFFRRFDETGNVEIMTYSSRARAFGSLCAAGFTEDDTQITEVKQIICQE